MGAARVEGTVAVKKGLGTEANGQCVKGEWEVNQMVHAEWICFRCRQEATGRLVWGAAGGGGAVDKDGVLGIP